LKSARELCLLPEPEDGLARSDRRQFDASDSVEDGEDEEWRLVPEELPERISEESDELQIPAVGHELRETNIELENRDDELRQRVEHTVDKLHNILLCEHKAVLSIEILYEFNEQEPVGSGFALSHPLKKGREWSQTHRRVDDGHTKETLDPVEDTVEVGAAKALQVVNNAIKHCTQT
jgi:hypothetical protein